MTPEPAKTQESAQERECIHRKGGIEGQYHTGESYVAALQRLRGERAQQVARKVGAFFWRDAQHVRVWLCHECEAELRP